MAVIDTFFYNGEKDILDLHLNTLGDHVDRFILCEAKTTFTGKPKPLYFSLHEKYFKKFWNKIDYFVIDEDYTPQELALAEASPNTQGASHWKREFLQKESIKKALTDLDDRDIVYVGDVDEIWNPENKIIGTAKLQLQVYAYWLNMRSSEEFYGTVKTTYEVIKNACLNHLRSNTVLQLHGYNGWHFTSMGGYKALDKKLQDQYTEESYYTPWVKEHLEENIAQSKDFLGRDFKYNLDVSDWPEYLKVHRRKYAHLCK